MNRPTAEADRSRSLPDPLPQRDLSRYQMHGYHPGRGRVCRILWYLLSLIVFESALVPLYAPKRALLRLFGAQIGRGVIIKPRVRIKYPWRLQVGDHSWIGEEVWIDNLDEVRIGDHVCISQEAYLCTGDHDHRQPTFDLITRPIELHSASWICTRATILAGVTVHTGAVVAAGSVAVRDVAAGDVVSGIPARCSRASE